MSTVSVIMPVFNAEATVEEAICSVLCQTFSDFELIIVDDGSTDRSLDLVQAIHDGRLHIILSENTGAAAARNLGISSSQSEFIAFLDADDIWAHDKLMDQLAEFNRDPTAGLVYSWSDYINFKGDFLCSGKRVVATAEPEETYGKLLVSNFLENGSTPLIRHDVLSDIGCFDESLESSQDLDLYLKIAAKYRFLTVQKVQVSYRVTPGSITSRITENEQKEIKFINKLFSQVPPKFRHFKRLKLSNLYRYLMLRTVEEDLNAERSLRAFRYLFLSIIYRPSLIFRQWKFIAVMFLKVSLGFMPKPISALYRGF